MKQVGEATREFAWEFEQHAQNMGMTKEDTKVHLVSALNQDTLGHQDTYISMRGGDEMAHLEAIQDRLHCVPYV